MGEVFSPPSPYTFFSAMENAKSGLMSLIAYYILLKDNMLAQNLERAKPIIANV